MKNQKRIYFFHIRKCGGTSLNKAFIRFYFKKKEKFYYSKIVKNFFKKITNKQNQTIIGWNKLSINIFKFNYAWSHHSFDDIRIRDKTFKFCIFRDPTDRLISWYNEFLNNKDHDAFKKLKHKKIRNIFSFLNLIPKNEIQSQLYTFSKKYNLNIAKKNILKLDKIYFFEDIKKYGYKYLINDFEIKNLKIKHERKSKKIVKLSNLEKTKIKKYLKCEYQFYNFVKKNFKV